MIENLEVLNKDLNAQLYNLEHLYEQERKMTKSLQSQVADNININKEVVSVLRTYFLNVLEFRSYSK